MAHAGTTAGGPCGAGPAVNVTSGQPAPTEATEGLCLTSDASYRFMEESHRSALEALHCEVQLLQQKNAGPYARPTFMVLVTLVIDAVVIIVGLCTVQCSVVGCCLDQRCPARGCLVGGWVGGLNVDRGGYVADGGIVWHDESGW
jgi:hypothetical protein